MSLPIIYPEGPEARPAPWSIELSSLPEAVARGLYVHIPFCFHKCHYCDFYSITRQSAERMERFVDLVLREAGFWSAQNGPGGVTVRPRTIFFGGGTPSLLPPGAMQRLLRGLGERLDLSEVGEWTVECNPATVSEDYCSMMRGHGVDRLSFGAQSFDAAELAVLEREHDPADVPRSVEIARRSGFERVNVDLIYAIPEQDLASWSRSLEQAIALGTEHISCYALTYEANTPMAVRRRLGRVRAVEDDVELEMFHHTRRRLAEAGYHAYEISNYAKPGVGGESGEACRHNLLYWNGGSYIGLGPSAASHVEGVRWKNRPHLREWEEAVEGGVLPAIDAERLSPLQRGGELAMLQLRLADGVEFDAFARQTGVEARNVYRDVLERLSGMGLIEVSEGGFRLSERGINVADAVAGEFLE